MRGKVYLASLCRPDDLLPQAHVAVQAKVTRSTGIVEQQTDWQMSGQQYLSARADSGLLLSRECVCDESMKLSEGLA